MNLLKEYEKKKSYKNQFPMLMLFTSKETFFRDIDMRNVLSREPVLTYNPESLTGFDELKLTVPDYDTEQFRNFKYTKPKIDIIDDICNHLIEIFKRYFRKVWDSKIFHLIFSSGGRDSRIIALILKELENEGMDLGELLFVNHVPEEEEFKASMKEMGWDEDRFMVWREEEKDEPDYYNVLDINHNLNGYSYHQLHFHDKTIDTKKTCLVSGSFSPAFRNLNYTVEFFLSRWASYNSSYFYYHYKDVLFPFVNYEYLNFLLFTDSKWFKKTHSEGGDQIRDHMCKMMGSTTVPFYVDHKYNLVHSQKVKNRINDEFRNSKFYNIFGSHPFIENMCPGRSIHIRRNFAAKCYGLATVLENMEGIDNIEFKTNIPEKPNNIYFNYVII